MTCLFWIAAALILWTYAGYPAVLGLRARGRTLPAPDPSFETDVSVMIAVRNETAALRAKVETLLACDHAHCIREVWIGFDGADEHTAQVCDVFSDPRIRCVVFETPRGKPTVLNALAPRCTAPLLLLTDARQPLAPDALGRLLAHAANPGVGVLSGELVFREERDTSGGRGMGAYWRYETWIRQREALVGSVPGSTGAITLMRRDLFTALPPDILLDDVWLPMSAIARGARCIFVPGAVAWDRPSDSAVKERVRKRRTLAGNLQILFRHPRWALPGGHPAWAAFLFHKVFRLLVPPALALLLLSSIVRSAHPFYFAAAVAQGLFYLLAVIGTVSGTPSPWFSLPAMFCALNLAAAQAWGDAVTGRFRIVWDRSDKGPSS